MFTRKQLQNCFLFSLLIFLNQACTSPSVKDELDKMKWLEGRWESKKDNIKTIETWQRKFETAYAVHGFMVEGNDTIFTEKITVSSGKEGINYVVIIADQNQGQPVSFLLSENTSNRLVFKNPDHDFPQVIRYVRQSQVSVLVELEGNLKGKLVTEKYTLFKRRS